MKKHFKIILAILLVLGAGAASAYYIATNNIAVLEPKGAIAIKERDLIVTASLLMLIIVIPVFVLTWFIAWHYREGKGKGRHEPDWEHNYIAEYCWWGVPMIIIVFLALITWRSSHTLNPFRPIDTDQKSLKIQVVALQWKWLFIYPEQGIATVNFVEFPEKTPIDFEITADAPMNSFWIPELGGQIYAMPSMRTKLHLIANEVGIFRGSSANISGKGFAGMFFEAKAVSNQDFNSWVSSVKKSGKALNWQGYLEMVKPSEYVPVSVYTLSNPNLFDQILKQYEPPSK